MKKILIAEDDKFLRNAYRVRLAKEGYEVKLAEDGEETITILSEFTPDLILLDIIMPRKDGFQVLTELQQNEAWAKIPVIISSNLGQVEDIRHGQSLGAKDYIVKSDTSIEEVVAKVHKVLGDALVKTSPVAPTALSAAAIPAPASPTNLSL